jgi:hypothetical protein
MTMEFPTSRFAAGMGNTTVWPHGTATVKVASDVPVGETWLDTNTSNVAVPVTPLAQFFVIDTAPAGAAAASADITVPPNNRAAIIDPRVSLVFTNPLLAPRVSLRHIE